MDTYEVLRILGEGGMGQVFEAQDHALNRRVAIKAAWPSANGSIGSVRHEARALAAFKHPSLVTVHSLGTHRDVDFIVMERIYGVSLGDHIERRREAGGEFSVAETVELLTAIADGLSVVHKAGIAHRDIKPANIMLTPDHRVVLMDFGLFLPEFDMASQSLIAGSPPYMAPEALLNAIEPGSGHLLDVFSLGVIAFDLLTGRAPWEAESFHELVLRIGAAPAPRLSKLRPDVPPVLEDLVADMLMAAPSERPQSVESVVWQLRAVLEGKRAEPQPKKPHVLIVDDDPAIVRVLGFYVQAELGEIELETVSDGEKALEVLRRRTPDAMLLDLHMPRMNGVEVCMYMRGEGLGVGTRVIAVSAGAQPDDVQVLHELGIRHVVHKDAGLRPKLAAALQELVGSVHERLTLPPKPK
jgi:serine/threonine-protein kinase